MGSDPAPQGGRENRTDSNHRADRACDDQRPRQALAAGCDDFDTKPIDFERLLGKMRRLLSVTATS